MCTAIKFRSESALFGRNLDIDVDLGEMITVIPRYYPLKYKYIGENSSHKAMMGMAVTKGGYPLFFDGVNEDGVAIAALNFTENAVYSKYTINRVNLAIYEFIPYILSNVSNIGEAIGEISKINLTDVSFDDTTPPALLHFLIADKERSITVEPTSDGIKIFENERGVLTNDPPFQFHTENLKGYLGLSNRALPNGDSNNLALGGERSDSFGMFGLPGDFSSPSRFIRAAVIKHYAKRSETITGSLSQAFHVLSSVSVPQGAVIRRDGGIWKTSYSSVIDQSRLIYYVRSYDNQSTEAVRLGGIMGHEPIYYPRTKEGEVRFLN